MFSKDVWAHFEIKNPSGLSLGQCVRYIWNDMLVFSPRSTNISFASSHFRNTYRFRNSLNVHIRKDTSMKVCSLTDAEPCVHESVNKWYLLHDYIPVHTIQKQCIALSWISADTSFYVLRHHVDEAGSTASRCHGSRICRLLRSFCTFLNIKHHFQWR